MDETFGLVLVWFAMLCLGAFFGMMAGRDWGIPHGDERKVGPIWMTAVACLSWLCFYAFIRMIDSIAGIETVPVLNENFVFFFEMMQPALLTLGALGLGALKVGPQPETPPIQ